MKKRFFLIPLLLSGVYAPAQIQKIKTTGTTPPVTKQVIISGQPVAIKNILVNTATYDFSTVKICVDQPPAGNNLPPRNNSAGKPVPKINSDGSLSTTGVVQQGLTAATEKMWNPGDVITVYLDPNNGTDWIRDRVKYYAKQWEPYANIKFDFITDFTAAKIKVGFNKTGKSWSWIGRDVLFNPLKKYTVNFGWFDDNTAPLEFSRTIVHEFGHVLGFLHEHQSPSSPLQWDLSKTYEYFKKEGSWTADEVNLNIINKYNQSNTNFSSYDRYSIMHYPIPDALLLSGSGTAANYWISPIDAQYAGSWYPFPPKGTNTRGNLRTNDDCDDINFSVEYDAVPSDKVEFLLVLGETNTKKVTWWKQIGIPLINNTEAFLEVQNHSLIAAENKTTAQIQIPFNEINSNKGISFWKGKFLSIHTLLDYKWNVLPAIKGGCRVRLTWNRDSCL